MGSDVAAPVVDKVNVPADTPIDGLVMFFS